MQLLQITSTPIKYEMKIERARLEYQQDFIPTANVSTTPARLNLKNQNTEVRLDTYEARRSLGFGKVADRIQAMADKGRQSIQQKTREAVVEGQQMSDIANGVTISQIVGQKMLKSTQTELYTAFLPSSGAEISWVPGKLDVDYQEGSLNYDWNEARNAMNYVPGSIRMNILEYPRVEIEYMGRPMYIPPSSDPEYVDPAG